MLESIKFPSLLCFSFQIGDILLTCHMARLCSKGAIGADWLLVLKQVVIWSSGAIVGSHVLSITSFDQDYNFLKAMFIYIPIRRLNNISVDYMFHYKYVNSTFAYFLGEKGTPRRAQSTRLCNVHIGFLKDRLVLRSGHPFPHPPELNSTRRVTRIRSRVGKCFHTRTRRVICTRRVTRTRKHTRECAARGVSDSTFEVDSVRNEAARACGAALTRCCSVAAGTGGCRWRSTRGRPRNGERRGLSG